MTSLTPTDPMQGNEIIAEFMKLYSAKRYYEGGKMQYHTSWDWLMPVCYKWKNLQDISIGMWDEYSDLTALLLRAVCELEIIPIYEQLIKCINWYNSTPNGTTNE